MYKYEWDPETGGFLLTTENMPFSKEPRPVYYRELDILGFDQFWDYPKDDSAPIMWAEMNNYIYRGNLVARIEGGSLYTKPSLIILERPEPEGCQLQLVNIAEMCRKNADMMQTVTQITIKRIYNAYRRYRKKTDVFYVAFSGGKDSVVALDLVQRALPHNQFIVVFGNTGMEFPTTLALTEEIKAFCESFIEKEIIQFYEATAPFSAEKSWYIFGPPARYKRWCCTIHKTAPVLNLLRQELEKNVLCTVMITGVRRDESPNRASYDEISLGKKLAGQYSFHPILEWNSAEIYLYIYSNSLPLNQAYKLGFNRVGCIMCPNSSKKHEYIKRCWFSDRVDKFCDIIAGTSKKDLSGGNRALFLETGGWKTRLSGRELNLSKSEQVEVEETDYLLRFTVLNLKDDWKEWYKTIGEMNDDDPYYKLEYNGVWRKCVLTRDENRTVFEIENPIRSQNSIDFFSLFKSVLIKSQYCIRCLACEAECAYKCVSVKNGPRISDKCVKCHSCLKIESGCLYYDSIKGSKDMKSLKGVNRYLSVGVDADWIRQYYADSSFEPGNRKTDVMFGFMGDAGMVSKRKLTAFGKFIGEQDLNNITPWALILCNLVYTPAFRWYMGNIPFYESYPEERLEIDMAETTKKARGEFWNGFKTIFDTNKLFQSIGFGIPDITVKTLKNGSQQKKMHSIRRVPWDNPIPEVILYSLYKFAEACGTEEDPRSHYQFSLSTLLDDTIERDGVSPTRIFGLDREIMTRILNALSINYPAFINAAFTLGLETITLRDDKTSADVLALF